MTILYSVLQPLKEFSKASYNIPKGLASMERVDTIMNAENDIKEPASPQALEGFNDCIRFEGVSFSDEEGKEILHNIDITIPKGKTVALVGQSGSGKSTIIKLITGELRPTTGMVHVNGYSLERIRKREAPYLRRTVGVVFQDFRLISKMTVYENVAFAMRVIGAREKEIKERVPYVLDLVGLSSKEHRHPGELSGGEQQRLAIARALVNNPSTIIADEPTGNLDPARSFEIMTLLQEINNLGTTMLVVTHEQHLVEQFGNRVITIDNGLISSDKVRVYEDQ